MFDFTTKQIDACIHETKEYIDKGFYADNTGLNRVLKEHEGTSDYIRKYNSLSNVFESLAKVALYFNNDIGTFKGNFYLAAKAGDICFKLYDKGYRTYSPICCDNDFEKRNNSLHYAVFAILAGSEELAKSITLEDSLLGAILMGEYEKAKDYLPQNIKDIPSFEDFDLILWTIIHNDEKKFQKYVEKRIKSQRNYAKKCGYVRTYMDEGTLALIKLARKRGMNCNLNIIELPMHVLDDNTPINEEEWKLPEDKELAEILGI